MVNAMTRPVNTKARLNISNLLSLAVSRCKGLTYSLGRGVHAMGSTS